MNLDHSPADLAFRDEVRSWLETNLPPEIRRRTMDHRRRQRDDLVRWHKILAAKGWAAPHWPVQYGGTGWSAMQRHIWDEESNRAGAPGLVPFGIAMVAPVIMKYGNAEQKSYYLPRILDCTDWWCQGYSEPGAGSDLASLKTRAELAPDGTHYIVNGQKAWTTLGQYANMIFCLVRTDPGAKQQEGISFLLVDMDTPGITVRPTIMLDEEHEVNDVFFDNVKVPVKNRVGDENKGWTYAKYLLSHERTGLARIGQSKRELAFLKRLSSSQQKNGTALMEDPVFGAKVAALEIELMALDIIALRVASNETDGKASGPEASMLKLKGVEIQQTLTELMLEAVGPYANPFEPDYLECLADHTVTGFDDAAPLASYYLNFRKSSIFGGSTEVQKNIIGKMILGL